MKKYKYPGRNFCNSKLAKINNVFLVNKEKIPKHITRSKKKFLEFFYKNLIDVISDYEFDAFIILRPYADGTFKLPYFSKYEYRSSIKTGIKELIKNGFLEIKEKYIPCVSVEKTKKIYEYYIDIYQLYLVIINSKKLLS